MPSLIFRASERVAGTIHRTSSRVRALQTLTGKSSSNGYSNHGVKKLLMPRSSFRFGEV